MFNFLRRVNTRLTILRPKQFYTRYLLCSKYLTCKTCLSEKHQAPVSIQSTFMLMKSFPSYNRSLVQQYSSEDLSNNSELTDAAYEEVSEETLDALTEKFEDLGEEKYTSDNFDVNYASGVITIKLGESLGTYVINKQTPNKQIWFSSPISGPKRYDFVNGTWVYKYDHMTLHERLSSELSEMYKTPIDFTNCSFGKTRL